MRFKLIDEHDINDKILFVRVDYDHIPNKTDNILDLKIQKTLPTLKYAIANGSKVVVASHITGPDHKYSKNLTMVNIAEKLSANLDKNIYFPDNSVGDAVLKIKKEMKPGDMMFLENLMFHEAEYKNNMNFAKQLADSIDIYVNEAFSLIKEHFASNLGILSFIEEKCIGFTFKTELEVLKKIKDAENSSLAVYFGGEDIGIKLDFLEHYIDKIDTVLFGGCFAYSFLKAIGYGIKQSQYDKSSIYRLKKLYSSIKARNIRILIPEDFVISSNNDTDRRTTDRSGLSENIKILGFGPKTLDLYRDSLSKAELVLWDGELGLADEINVDLNTYNRGNSLVVKDTKDTMVILISDYKLFGKEHVFYPYEKLFQSCSVEIAYSYLLGEELETLEALGTYNG